MKYQTWNTKDLRRMLDKGGASSEETLESAGCDGQCPMYPGAHKTKDGYPDCSKCPQRHHGRK